MDKFNTNNLNDINFKHGGNILTKAKKLNLLPSEIIDSSASLVPFKPPKLILDLLSSEIKSLEFQYYPEKNLINLREIIGEFHQINPDNILPGNGASELITWAGYEASKCGASCIPSPCFVDYERSLNAGTLASIIQNYQKTGLILSLRPFHSNQFVMFFG